jgi:hypothetical protein
VPDLFRTIVDLVKLGNFGVGVAILLLGFVLALQTKPVEPATARLRSNFLWVGFAYAIITLVVGLVPLFVNGGPVSERLAFSPDFDSEKLQPPVIRLPDGTQATHNAKFDLQPSAGTQVVTIAMDGTLDQVRNLRQASADLTSTVAKVTKQRDALASKAAAVKQTSQNQPKAPALQYLEQNSANVEAIQADFNKSLTVGDYARVKQLTARLQTTANAAEPAVAVIAKQPH